MKYEQKLNNDYIYFKLFGEFEFTYLKNLFSQIRTECENNGLNKALIDCIEVKNLYKSDMERFFIGKTIAHTLRRDIKLAAVVGNDKFNLFGEYTANNRGANFKLFTYKDNALEWLF